MKTVEDDNFRDFKVKNTKVDVNKDEKPIVPDADTQKPATPTIENPPTPNPDKPEEGKVKDGDVSKEEPKEIIINDEKFTLDEKGNAVNEKNEVIYTKEEIEAAATTDDGNEDENTVNVNNVLSSIGIEIKDESGKPISYESTEDGIRRAIEDVYKRGKIESNNEAINELFTEYPVLKDALNYMQIHSTDSLDGYQKEPNYSKVTLDEKNEKQLADILYKSRILKGDTEAEAQRYVQYSKDDNKLGEDAKNALDYLKNKQKSDREYREQVVERQRLEQIEEARKFAGFEVNDNGQIKDLKIKGSVYDKIINTNNLDLGDFKFNIPQTIKVKLDNGKVTSATRNDFLSYLMIPKERLFGSQKVVMTDYEYDLELQSQNTTIDKNILDAYKLFTGLSDSELAEQKLNQREVDRIRKLTIKKSGSAQQRPKPTGDVKVKLPFN